MARGEESTLGRTDQVHVVYCHQPYHQAPDATIRNSNAFDILTVIFPSPSPSSKEESMFVPRSEICLSPLARDTLNTRSTQRLTCGDGYVGSVRADPALGVNAALRAVRRMSSWAERIVDEESMLIRKARLPGGRIRAVSSRRVRVS